MSGELFSMEQVKTVKSGFELGEAAAGNIDPAARNLDQETLANVERDVLDGRFDTQVLDGVFLPCGCIDGRCPYDGEAFNAVPNASGGTLSLLVGELLTNGSNIARTAENSEEALASLVAHLQTNGYGDQIGGHTAPSNGNETASGCGANDQLRNIMGQIAEKPDVIFSVLEQLGVSVDAETVFPAMVAKARELNGLDGYFEAGKKVSETLQGASPEGNCPELQGAHNEVIIRINTVEGTTIDRRALKEAYGDEFQIFNVDVWSLRKAADTLSLSVEEADNKFAAMVIYQVATAFQLCGPSMRVVVR